MKTKYKFRNKSNEDALNRFRRHLALKFSWWRINDLNTIQAEMTKKIQVSRSVMYSIESGKTSISFEVLTAIADAYGYDVIIDFKERNENGKS